MIGRRRFQPAQIAALVLAAALAAACSDTAEGGTPAATTAVAGSAGTTAPSASATTAPASTAAPTTPASTAPPTVTEAPPTTVAGQQRLTFAFSGDILIHSNVWLAAQANAGGVGYDFAPMFADIEPLLDSVDLAVCHLEVPLAPPGKEPSTYPRYGAPRELVAGIAAGGYDNCSTASNHSFDQGAAGIDTTLAEFDAQGITQVGMARTKAEIAPRLLDVSGVRVAHLAYTYGYNGEPTPNGEWWRAAKLNPERIINDARTAREMGAQVVILSLHWGSEPLAEITRGQRVWAEEITKSGLVDLIVGHHSHMVQPIEQVNGVWTVFGMGNSLSDHPTRGEYPPATQDGVIVTVGITVGADGFVTVESPQVHPTWVDRTHGYVIRDVLAELQRTDLTAAERATYEVSLWRTAQQVRAFIVPYELPDGGRGGGEPIPG